MEKIVMPGGHSKPMKRVRKYGRGELLAKTVALLEANPDLTAKELQAELHVSSKNSQNVIRRAQVAMGKTRRVKPGSRVRKPTALSPLDKIIGTFAPKAGEADAVRKLKAVISLLGVARVEAIVQEERAAIDRLLLGGAK